MWSTWDATGIEHVILRIGQDEVAADGFGVGIAEGRQPFRFHYEVRCDANWGVRSVHVFSPVFGDIGEPPVHLLADGKGNWTTSSRDSLPDLEGCVDVDISATPFTNTIPIRRLGLAQGDSAELSVAYVDASEMRVWREEQRYTCLEKGSSKSLYKYESLDGGFTAKLPVDEDGLVLDYPSLFKRTLF